ncbi:MULTISPECIES: FecCD family ABC transporter permease [unclassified Luteococcus]|uniref:FecCD family ABC transporter permease n=1 Tax=unclassified Luteococcus TaxID=2639923 RepID=UPI00313AF975
MSRLAIADAVAASPRSARHGRAGQATLVPALALLVAVLALTSLFVGSRLLTPGAVAEALRHHDASNTGHAIVVRMRIPRAVVGILAGIGLGAAAAVIQSMTRNPLAEPGLLGINAGASAAVCVGIVEFGLTAPLPMMLLAMTGAGLAGTVVLLIGGAFSRTADPIRLVLAGVAISSVLGALTSLMILNQPQAFADFRNWDAGGVAPRPWPLVGFGAGLLAVGLMVALAAARSLDALALGADMGRALGVSLGRAWALGGVSIVILCGASTALVGPIGFLGLVAAIGARRLIGGGLAAMIPVAGLLAAGMLLASDLIGRIVAMPGEVAAGVVCALAGAPAFVALARGSRVVTA